MTSGVEKKLTKHLVCAICLERFKEPKVLTCQHVCCKTCLERLVTADGRGNYGITCPECRQKTQVPRGDVSSLPSNFLINKLLSELDGQPAASPVCSKHKGKKFKLFCQTCDQLICKDCALIDHRDYDYKFVNDVYPAEKDKIVKLIEKLRGKITALETSLATIQSQEDWARHNFEEVSSKVDALINDHIEALERKRQSFKEQLQEFSRVQKHLHETQKKLFTAFLNRVKRSVELAEQALKKGDELGVLATKHEILKQLTDTNSATEKTQVRGMISCNVKIDSPLYEADVQKIAKITQCDEEYTLGMFDLMEQIHYASKDKVFISKIKQTGRFEIQSKNDSKPHWAEAVDVVQVNIKKSGSTLVYSSVIERNRFGLFTFSYCPAVVGKYEIEVRVNGRYLEGSPFTWEVKLVGPSLFDIALNPHMNPFMGGSIKKMAPK